MELSAALEALGSNQRRRLDRDKSQLIASKCANCSAVSWPSRVICHVCGSPECPEVALGPAGILVTYTTVWIPRAGFTPPYTLGQIDVDDQVRVFAHVRELPKDVTVPIPLQLVVNPDEGATPVFWFVPAKS
jgi:uncharacterized OB-fold protein